MSIELHVFLPISTAPTVSTWQRAIEEAGFATVLQEDISADSHRGFFPAKYNGKPTGFEFDLDDASNVLETYPHIARRVGDRQKCATFRWGGDLLEMCAALSAAASLAKLAGGLYFYPEDDLLYEADQALVATQKDLKGVRA